MFCSCEVSHSKIICRISQQEESSGTSSRRREPHFVSSTGVHKTYTKGDQQHEGNMECMANEVANCLKTVRYNGKSIITQHGIGEEDNF